MGLSGAVRAIAFAVLAIVAVVVWVAVVGSDDESAGRQGRAGSDLETRLGIDAAKSGDLGHPQSLHSKKGGSSGGSGLRSSPRGAGALPGDFVIPDGAHPVMRVRPGAKVLLRDRPGGERVATVRDTTKFGSPMVLGIDRISGRWLGVISPELPNGKLGWIRFHPRRTKLGWTKHSLHVDLSERRATLRLKGRPLFSFTITVGAEATQTPTGRFSVTDTFRGGLNPVYGCCAVAISATQPNLAPGWPGGDRIALHGNGTGQALGQAVSNGCMRAEDEVVSALVDTVALGTLVLIRS